MRDATLHLCDIIVFKNLHDAVDKRAIATGINLAQEKTVALMRKTQKAYTSSVLLQRRGEGR